MKPCTRCGIDKELSEYPSNTKTKDRKASWCRECYKIYQRGKDRVSLYLQRGEKEKLGAKRSARKSQVKRKYNTTLEEYESRLGGVDQCEICSKEFSDEVRKNYDHDHKSGEFRGVLCISCNMLLGHANDDVDILERAKGYLDKSRSFVV